jgi:hypothetical protein
MAPNETKTEKSQKSPVGWIFIALIIIGLTSFIYGLASPHPERAWQAYLINFLLWSAIAQGAGSIRILCGLFPTFICIVSAVIFGTIPYLSVAA